MRHTYKVASDVPMQVNWLKGRKNMLLWYTGDEPGKSEYIPKRQGIETPRRWAPKASYDLIKSLDPYHSVSLCLNYENYYFQEYSAGADVILSDVYPTATGTSWSFQYKLEDAMLLSIVNAALQDVLGPVSMNLSIDVEAASEISTLWGDGGWKFGTDADLQLRRNGMDALKVDILLLRSED
ncbi:MAG: hypothetical protein Q9164_001749 [Protoblastenia rupestris]